MMRKAASFIGSWLLLAHLSSGDTTEQPGALLQDPNLFPSELFPGLDELDESELLLESLKRRYPGRVLDQALPELREQAGDPIVQLGTGGVTYVRVLNLSAAFPAIEQSLTGSIALIDLRYVSGTIEPSLNLGSTLVGSGNLTLEIIGDYGIESGIGDTDLLTIRSDDSPPRSAVVIVLTNGMTSGFLEPVLSELQAAHSIIGIGMQTAGRTATYRSVPGYQDWYTISGEIRSGADGSLVDTGFMPAILVEATADEDLAGYEGFDPARPLSATLEQAMEKERFDEARLQREFSRSAEPITPTPDSETASEPPPATDPVFRHAFFVIEGMRALGRLPAD
ncbi:MAG: hypothetical protein DRP71_11390 [Verrucomicrobia bacterium]|nr:MAG: hypothetical protein DRP71_11390 [Verrucomicrobiota bacterium]